MKSGIFYDFPSFFPMFTRRIQRWCPWGYIQLDQDLLRHSHDLFRKVLRDRIQTLVSEGHPVGISWAGAGDVSGEDDDVVGLHPPLKMD